MAVETDALKLSFQLTAQGDHLEVRATALRGEGRVQTALPSPLLLSQLAEYDPAHMPLAPLQSAGQSLYRCLAVGDVAKLAADVLLEARAAHQPAQFELRFDPDQVALAQHPWEILADDLGQFLVRDGLVDVTRYITYPQPPPALSFATQDKCLLRVICQPQQLPPLAIADLPVTCQTIAHATFASLSERLLIERLALWGLHFDGHGALVRRCDQCDDINALDAITCSACGARLSEARQIGVLAFESNGSVEWVPAQEFGSILYNAQVQLALLLACETARLGEQWIFSGLAPSLVLAGVPAVIGMQYPVSDRFANGFTNSFYKALLQHNDVLAALRVARQMSVQSAWYSPVLYLRHRKATDEVIRPAYHTRNIDTAVPAQARAGSTFLVRLWIRRPQTKPLTTEQLRQELNIPAHVPVSTREAKANIKFEPRADERKLRRGEVEVKLTGTNCSVTPESIKLFVDEDLDAPPAIFTVRVTSAESISLIFSLWQDGGQIASVTHWVQVTHIADSAKVNIETSSFLVSAQASPVVEAVITAGAVQASVGVTRDSFMDTPITSDREMITAELAHALDSFGFYELRELCFELGLDMDDLFGQGVGRREKAIGIVEYLLRHGRLHELIESGRRIRPDIDWHYMSEKAPSRQPDTRMQTTPIALALSMSVSHDFRTRIAGVHALGRWGSPFIDRVIIGLADDYPQVRVAAIQALEKLQPTGEWRMHLKYECYVPAGKFIMGEGKEAHAVCLEAFYIGKYLVTNADYKRYCDDIERPFDIPAGKEDHPVVNVSWYDARDYAAWAGMRLPTDAEWEKAAGWQDAGSTKQEARGKKRIYPWGDEFDKNRCNTGESGIHDTTLVGMYSPQGDSPYGCADMGGNAWEWCQSKYAAYPYKGDDGREELSGNDRRVLRGGSWYFDHASRHPLCACRTWSDPGYRVRDLGFRVIVSPDLRS